VRRRWTTLPRGKYSMGTNRGGGVASFDVNQ
jgi:hypothetical protein